MLVWFILIVECQLFSTAAKGLEVPLGLDLDAKGHVIIADTGHDQIRLLNGVGKLSKLANGFKNPSDVSVDLNGSIYIMDHGNKAIKRLDPNGLISIVVNNVTGQGIKVRNGNLYYTDGIRKSVMMRANNGQIKTVAKGFSFPGKYYVSNIIFHN